MDERKLFDMSQLLVVAMVAIGACSLVTTISTVLFSVIIPAAPFVGLALLLSFADYARLSRCAIYGAEVVAILLLLSCYGWLYVYSSNPVGVGANIGMGLMMMSLPMVLVVVMVVGWYAGANLCLRPGGTGTY